METPRYLHLKPGDAPPRLEGVAPFKAVLVIDSEVTPEWQAQVYARAISAKRAPDRVGLKAASQSPPIEL